MMNEIMLQRRTRAFTLVELMVVLLVIGVLGSILFSGATYLFGDQAIKQAKAEIKILQLSLEDYKRDYGTFPTTEDLEGMEECAVRLLQVLSGTHDELGEEFNEGESRKSYLPLDKFTLETLETDKELLIDPWEEPYQYNFPRLDGHEGYLLFSKGPDKETQFLEGYTDGVPEKTAVDMDNIPSTEPGKW